MGCDGTNLRIHKELANIIMKHLLIIFEQSWESGEVPVFKRGKKDDPGNNRPVRLMPSKIMEMMMIILGGIEKHLKDNRVIGHSQHIFMRGKPCLSKLISFYAKVTHPADQKTSVDEILLDFSKALDIICLSVQPTAGKIPHVMGEELAHWSSTNNGGNRQSVTCGVPHTPS